MFDRLIVSAKEKSQGRTKKFFLATTFIYSFAVASALAVSVFAASPALFESSEIIHLTPVLPLSSPPKESPAARPASRQAAQPNPYNVATLDKITHPESNPGLLRAGIKIPSVGTIGDGGPGVIGAPNGVPDGDPTSKGIGVPVGVPHGEEMAPPPPVVKKPEPQPQPKAQENKVVRLASNILTGKAIARKTPDYPPIARQIRVEGSIVVEIVISPEGRVESARALNGHPLLTKTAVDAAYAWRFEPTILNGMPVRVTGVITFNFKLN